MNVGRGEGGDRVCTERRCAINSNGGKDKRAHSHGHMGAVLGH